LHGLRTLLPSHASLAWGIARVGLWSTRSSTHHSLRSSRSGESLTAAWIRGVPRLPLSRTIAVAILRWSACAVCVKITITTRHFLAVLLLLLLKMPLLLAELVGRLCTMS